MDARKGNIYEILNGNKQFLIPVYQRFYSWDIDQCKRLWNDIVEMQRKGKAGHFVGSIVNIAEQAMPTGVVLQLQKLHHIRWKKNRCRNILWKPTM